MRLEDWTKLTLSYTLAQSPPLSKRQSTVEPYAPTTTSCPSGSLVRTADSLNSDENSYIEQRGPKAAESLSTWLGSALGDSYAQSSSLPRLALAVSGGGPKAGLTAAGAIYGLDGREDSGSAVKGLLQSMIYISALSGGSLTLSGIMSNDFAQVSTLRQEIWETNYQNPFGLAISNRDNILADVGNKTAAGYPTSLDDLYGRVLAYNYISTSPSGGHDLLWSNVTTQPSFQDFDAPYPIITITQADPPSMCYPNMSAAIWEVSPFEFGSWDDIVAAFYPTKYLGTRNSQGSGQCTIGFDNTGFMTGISSNILPNRTSCSTGNSSSSSLTTLATLISSTYPGVAEVNPYGLVPNPFYQSQEAGSIRDMEILYGTDGGFSGQGIPIFPFIQPERDIDVIVIVDSTSSTSNGNITNGDAVFQTYTSAQAKGLSKMPAVPSSTQFLEQNFSSGAHFYGCNDKNVTTLIYLPNTDLGNVTSGQFTYTADQINSTIQGGINMVTQNGDEDWPTCLACAVVHKTDAQLPDACEACLEKYCWPTSTSSTGPTGSASPTSTSPAATSPTAYTGAAFATKPAFALLAGVAALVVLVLS